MVGMFKNYVIVMTRPIMIFLLYLSNKSEAIEINKCSNKYRRFVQNRTFNNDIS